jgi:hypothetical protein
MTSYPQTAGGNDKVSRGDLPLSHPQWIKLADHNHRLRCLSNKCYALAKARQRISMCTHADALRLKRNVCYAVHQYKNEDFATFKRSVWAVLHHHFGDHSTCGEWCPCLRKKDDPEALKKLFYRCKTKNAKLYSQVLKIWNTYCSDKALHDIHHKWHTNKCESMNKFITKFVPKTTHLCTMIVGKARAHLAVALDSVGYENTYSTLFDILGMEYDHDICGGHHKQLDGSKKYNQTYDKKDGAQ